MVRIAGLVAAVDRQDQQEERKPVGDRNHRRPRCFRRSLFFPKSYALYAGELAEDIAVSVQGRINERDGTVSVIAQEMTLLDLAPATTGGPPVIIALRNDKITAELAAELRHILRSHRGTTRVVLRMESPGKSPLLVDLRDYPIEPTSGFKADIKSLLGASALASC